MCGLLLAAAAAASRADDPYADTVVSYVPGTGQSTSYENSSAALGAPDSAATITAPAFGNTNIVGIGNGGELTVEFNSPILNDPADHAEGLDFTIFGNEFFVNGSNGISSVYDHPGLSVWVSEDNITYYQLAAPQGADDSFPTEASGDPGLPVSTSLSLSSFTGLTVAQALGAYDGSAGGSSYSISWAEDAEGASVDLPSISYIKVEGTGGYGYVDAFARVESVPEPAAGVLALLGAAALALHARRRRADGL
jgi:MYXO-CTERM domain-containing protein